MTTFQYTQPLFEELCKFIIHERILKDYGTYLHRRLQSCVGIRARLGYAAFDAQLRKRIALHCTLYTVVCTCVSTLMLV